MSIATLNSIAKSFTAVGAATAFRVKNGGVVTGLITGTWVGTWQLQKTQDNWNTAQVVATGTGNLALTQYQISNANGQTAQVRFFCVAYTSGTMVTTCADLATDVSFEQKDALGNVVKTVTPLSVNFPIGIALTGVENTLTAAAGGTQAAAVALNASKAVHRVTVVGSGNDSVSLPAATGSGRLHLVINSAAANSMQVFGAGTDTINDVATATGVAIAAGKSAWFIDLAAGAWYMNLSA